MERRLTDIIRNIEAIMAYTAGLSLDKFAADSKTLDATERCLERIAEASIKIGAERMTIIAPTLPSSAMRGMGNFLRYHYDAVDPRITFKTVKEDLPILHAACLAALKEGS
jgi:uncharacterized protein with HEPN domain